MSNIDNSSGLSQQALSIFGDSAARDAIGKIKKLQAENEKGAPLLEQIQKMKVYNGDDEVDVAAITIALYDADDETHFMYHLKDKPTFPHSKLNRFYCRCNGIFVAPDQMGACPRLRINDNEISLSYKISDHIVLLGKIIDYEGSLDDVQKLIDGHYRYFFNMMGMFEIATGLPALNSSRVSGGNVLENSTFVLETICVAKHIVQPILDIEIRGDGGKETDLTLEELNNAAHASPHHIAVTEATKAYESAKKENVTLQLARDISQSLNGYAAAAAQVGNPQFQFKLEDGTVSRMPHCRDGNFAPSWRLDPTTLEPETVLLSSLANFQVTIAGVPICKRNSLVNHRPIPMLEGNMGFSLKYSGEWEVEALFMFDDTSEPFIAEGDGQDFFRRVEYTLVPEDNNNITMNGHNGTVTRLTGVTVRLVAIHVQLDRISSRLKELGIEHDASVLEE